MTLLPRLEPRSSPPRGTLRAARVWSLRGRCCGGIGHLCARSGGSRPASAGGLKGANIGVVRRSAVAHADDLQPRRRVHDQRLKLGVDDSARAPECSRMYWISGAQADANRDEDAAGRPRDAAPTGPARSDRGRRRDRDAPAAGRRARRPRGSGARRSSAYVQRRSLSTTATRSGCTAALRCRNDTGSSSVRPPPVRAGHGACVAEPSLCACVATSSDEARRYVARRRMATGVSSAP
jgi:hypothetical protein